MPITWSWEISGDCVEKSGNVYLFSTHKLCFTGNQGCTSCSLLNLVMAKRLPGSAGFEIWHFKMPEEAISGAVVSVAVEAPGLKGSWCTELRLGTIRKYGERRLVKLQSVVAREPSILVSPRTRRWSLRKAAAMGHSQAKPTRQAVCAMASPLEVSRTSLLYLKKSDSEL